MSMNINFDLVGIAVLIVLMIYFQRKRSSVIASYRMFYVILFDLLLMGIMDIACVVTLQNAGITSPVVMSIVNVLDVFTQIFLLTSYAAYVLCVATIDTNPPQNWMNAIYLPSALQMMLVTGLAIRGRLVGDSPDSFKTNPVMKVVLMAGVVYEVVIMLIIGIRYSKVLGLKKNIHAVTAGVCLAIGGMIEFYRPDYFLTVFIGTLVMTDLLMTVQKPEEIFERSDAMKKKFLYGSAEMDLDRGKSFGMIFIKILDYSVLMDSLGKEDTEAFLKHVTAFLTDLKHNALVFQLDSDLLAVKFPSTGKIEEDSIFEEVQDRFKEPWHSGFMEAMLSVGFLRVGCPSEINNIDTFKHMLGNMNLVQMQPGEEYPLEKLLGDDKEQQMLKAIRRALDEDGFQVYYQPIYSTREKKVIAAEALIRLFDPEYGFIPPEPMIALAEKEGYILRIGEIVFTEVCRFYSKNKLDKLGIEYIEVNLSAVQCMQKLLAEQFIGIMKEYKLGPERINFEITESSAMINDAEVTRNIARFEQQGVSLSLDDYGTGYSNISYLYNLPFMIMKVDKSILWTSEKNEKADIILKNTFRMAKRLKMKVVMEGVETEEQIKKLLALDCDYFQGFYFSKPVEGKKFIEYVKGFSLPEVCKG